jgi:superfamily I DNA and/or RNA helicase
VNLKDIRTMVSFDELWVHPLSGKISLDAIGRITATDDREIFQFFTGQEPALIKIRDREFCMDLNFYLKRGCTHLAQIMQGTKDNSFFMMKVSFFGTATVEMDVIEVGIDKRIEDTAKRYEIFNTQDDLAEILAKKCIITDGKNTWFIIKTGNAGETEYSQDDSVKSDSMIPENAFAFSICGDGFVIPVIKRKLDESTEIFFATKIVYANKPNHTGALTLVKGSLIFSGLAKRIQQIAANALHELEKQDENYLSAWDKYGNIEGDLLLRKARDVGIIKYSGMEKTSNGFKFYMDKDISDALNETDEIELVKPDDIPAYLFNKEMTWKEYSEKLEEEFKKRHEEKDKDVFAGKDGETEENLEDNNDKIPTEPSVNNNDEFRNKSFGIAEILDRSISLKGFDIDPPKDMVLVLSIMGDLVQIERRMKARLAIKEGRGANPLLGLIIEEGGVIPQIGRVTKINPLSPFVKEKIFHRNHPTDRQKEAIDIALNTPDIALIQGPPGTGKTTVIAAILERLNEEYDKKKSIQGKILVSGFQHDAVDNIISRLSINSLPAIKFGRRSGGAGEDDNVGQIKIEQWIREIKEEIQKKNPQIRPLEEQKKLQVLFRQYAVSPAKNTAFDIIDLVLSLPRTYITGDIVADADAIRQSLQEDHRPINREISVIRALRITEDSFVDDGQYNAMMLLVSIQNQLSPEETAVLNKATSWKPGDPLTFLAELADLQNTLLKRFIPPPVFTIEKPRKEILNLIEKVNAALAKRKSSGSKKEEALANFLYELETNPEGIRESIKEYVFVYGATTQGTEGKDIKKAKTANLRDTAIRYDTVIIDEAARVSPRDLLIPMAQAEKRIILVGDHRQLPHIVDDEIIRSTMTEEANKEESEDTSIANNKFEYYIKHSMFEYLKKRLEDLSAKDGVKRTVTLDKQYRAHPLLGNFINQYFYAPHNGEGFESPLPEEYFRHDLLNMDGKPALWINVDGKKGAEEHAGFSRTRRQEAKAIARQLKIWIDSEEGKQLTFGVISFYRAQSILVFEELGKQGITERPPGEGDWKIKEDYAYLTKKNSGLEERLRIGTVDSFQGMEFDVVFLSMVRSPRHIPDYKNVTGGTEIQKTAVDEKLMINIFGHLMSENRLCVSMSRQKKILVVAGNAALAQSDIGRAAVPALAAFCDLCKEKGKYYDFQ